METPDFKAIAAVLEKTEPITLEIEPIFLFVLVGTVQLALRYPGNRGASADIARKAAIAFQQALGEIDPAIAQALEQGWHPEFDVTSEEFDAIEAENTWDDSLYESPVDSVTGLRWGGFDQQPITAKNGSRIPDYYHPPHGTPLRWQDDQTGELRAAVMAYFDRHPTAAQVELIRDWLRYYANAPCWTDIHGVIAQLVREAPLIRSMADVDQWLSKAMPEGIDPF